jgi:polar amino acid transport system permease protein
MSAFSLLFGPDGWGGLLLEGAVVTILLALATVPVGFGAGLALAVLKTSPNRLLRMACEGYTTFFRGIPDLLALFIVYFGLQLLLDRLGQALSLGHLELNAFVAGVIALGTIAAAYSSEVWVAAMQAVPRGQSEAALSLGLDRKRLFFLVLMPQLVRVALPGLGNVWTIMLKDTSLISTLAVMDLLRAASYLVFSIASAMMQAWLERRSNRGYA